VIGPEPRYLRAFPAIQDWIESALKAHAPRRRSVESFNFRRLPLYFPPVLLKEIGVVTTDRVPVPPLSAAGLTEFRAFEQHQPAGITFRDTYFLKSEDEANESIHFHELIHALQWQALGDSRFLLLYADGLRRHGYVESPLEAMAFRHQADFDRGREPYDVESAVLEEVRALSGLDALQQL
jgi:hypothetical protein